MIGDIHKITKRNLLKGVPWRFGSNWPGQRCEAKTRKGTPCQRPAKLPVGRCRLHGGASTGPRTEDGLMRLILAKTKHGKFTKAKREKAKQISKKSRKIRKELKELESWFVDYGHLEKNWRKDWGIWYFYYSSKGSVTKSFIEFSIS